MHAEIVIYKSLQEVGSLNFPAGESTSGGKFEDYMVKQLYQRLQQQVAFRVFTPRYTLREATFSGACHQFDIVIAEQEELVAVECKFRRRAHIEELFATLGKLIDYRKRPRGIFVTTARDVNNEMYWYALAHRVSLISPSLPPVEYMLQCARLGTDTAHRLETMQDRMRSGTSPQQLMVEWKNNYTRFRDEGYC